MAQRIGDELGKSVEKAAERLGVSADEVWKMINTGELSVEETVGGGWAVPAWSIDYLISARAREARPDAGTRAASPVPRRVSEPPSKGEAKRLKQAKKWKRKFDELGRRKNELERERRELLRGGDASGKGRLPELDQELRGVEAARERHEEEGIEFGFLRRAGARAGRGLPGTVLQAEAIGLAKIGLRPGLRFSNELEMFNPPDPQGNSWEESTARNEPCGADASADVGRVKERKQGEQGGAS